MKTSINLIKWICICLFFKYCNSNSFANPYVLQELFIKELEVRTHLENANIELKSDDIKKYVKVFSQILWKSIRCHILVTFPTYLKKLHSIY